MCANKINILLIFYLFTNPAFGFWDQLEHRWLAGESIEFSEYVNMNEPVRDPPGATIVLGEVILLTEKFHYTKDCIVYQVPTSNQSGFLKIINIELTKNCKDFIFAKDPILSLSNCYNLAFQLEERKLLIEQDLKKYEITLFNSIRSKPKKIGDTSALETQIPGVQISYVKGLGERLKDGTLCFDVDDNCKQKTKWNCEQCERGSYPIIASACSKEVRHYCGSRQCGIVNGPACIRGERATGYTGPYCINDSPLAYCLKPARVICINGELICR